MFLYPPGEEPPFSPPPGQSALSALRLLKPAAGASGVPPDVSADEAVAGRLAGLRTDTQLGPIHLKGAAQDCIGR